MSKKIKKIATKLFKQGGAAFPKTSGKELKGLFSGKKTKGK
jgi:hypothetical protein